MEEFMGGREEILNECCQKEVPAKYAESGKGI